jgi:uncharacterized protein (TIGR02118 family)
MEENGFLRLVGINCPPELDDEFNRWYNTTHVPLIMKFPRIKKAIRAKIDQPISDLPQYLAIYEFESRTDFEDWLASPELAAAAKEANETWSEKKYERKFFVEYEVVKIWGRDT